MAIVTNSANTYASGGQANSIREQLSDVISNISPYETPFLSSLRKENAKNTKVEFLKDALATPSTSNAQLEGETYSASAVTDVTRLDNMCQIFAKSFAVSGTQDSVDHSSMSTYSAYVLSKRAKELKTDIETALMQNGAKVTGGTTTARQLAGLRSWIATNRSKGGGSGANPNGLGTNAPTNGTQRALTEDLLKGVLKDIWDNGGDAKNIYVGSFNKQKISSVFTGGATAVNRETKDATVYGAVSVYQSDFGTLTINASRHQEARDLFAIDPDLWALATLRDYKVEELAKTGDAKHWLLTCEHTLISKNEAGNGCVADLTTA